CAVSAMSGTAMPFAGSRPMVLSHRLPATLARPWARPAVMLDDRRRQARLFRSYALRRRDGSHAPEYLRPLHLPGGLVAGVRAGRHDPGAVLVRRPGRPWCYWLGARAALAEDPDFQA